MRDIIRNDFWEEAFGDLFRPIEKKSFGMKTDIKENDKQFELDIDVPGFKKDEINVELRDGYLTISATKSKKDEEKDEKGANYVRRERYSSVSRSYFVGDKIAEEDIKAKYDNGVLTITIPKEEPKKPQEHKIKID